MAPHTASSMHTKGDPTNASKSQPQRPTANKPKRHRPPEGETETAMAQPLKEGKQQKKAASQGLNTKADTLALPSDNIFSMKTGHLSRLTESIKQHFGQVAKSHPSETKSICMNTSYNQQTQQSRDAAIWRAAEQVWHVYLSNGMCMGTPATMTPVQ